MAELTRQEISKLVREYHGHHGDTGVRCCRAIRIPHRHYDENGKFLFESFSEYHLVHINNTGDCPYSILDCIFYDASGQPYVTEMYSAPRQQEDEMIAWLKEGEE